MFRLQVLPIAVVMALLLVAPLSRAEVGNAALEAGVQNFYAWVLAHPSAATPTSEERAVLAELLSPQLIRLLEEVSRMEEQCIKTTQAGDKPDVFEGDLFVGNYEGATEVAYGKMTRQGEIAVANVNLVYVDTSTPKAGKYRAIVWKSQVELRRFGTRWLVQNVRFERRQPLVSMLRQYLKEGARSCRDARPEEAGR